MWHSSVMPPSSAPNISSRAQRAVLRVAFPMLLVGCPAEETPVEVTGDSTGASTTVTSPTTLDCGTGGCETTPQTSASSSDTTAADTTSGTTGGTTSGTTSGTTGGTTSGTTSGSSSDGGPLLDLGVIGTSGSDTGVGFIVALDVGAGMDCSPWLQDCPVGEKCNAWDSSGGGAWDANACFAIDPAPVGVGDVCTVVGSGTSGVDNCELGAMCWGVDVMTNEGTCVALCTGTPMAPVCAPAGTSCVIENGGVLTLCLPACDPLLQDCAAGDGCYLVGDDFVCAPDASGAQGVDGDDCAFINVCDPGLYCADSTSVEACFGIGCCTPFCDLSAPGDPCPAVTEECVAVYPMGMAPLGLEDVGVCAIP